MLLFIVVPIIINFSRAECPFLTFPICANYMYFLLVPGLRIRIANLVFKLLSCLLYITRVATDIDPTYATWWVSIFNSSPRICMMGFLLSKVSKLWRCESVRKSRPAKTSSAQAWMSLFLSQSHTEYVSNQFFPSLIVVNWRWARGVQYWRTRILDLLTTKDYVSVSLDPYRAVSTLLCWNNHSVNAAWIYNNRCTETHRKAYINWWVKCRTS